MQTERRMATNPQTKPTNLGCESADFEHKKNVSAEKDCYRT